jgi:hypothetical protein
MNAVSIKITNLHTNTGQIPGVPANPRFIKDEPYEKLKKSIQDDPEMLDLRELIVYPYPGKKGHYVIIGGNMRYRICKELGYKDMPTKIIPEDTPPEKLRAYLIKDNVAFGDWDIDLLANEWENEELADWGVDLPDFDTDDNYGDRNKEIDVNQFDDEMTIKLKYPEDEFNRVREGLSKIAQTPEGAVWKLLGYESTSF